MNRATPGRGARPMHPARIGLTIDRLVLHGFAPADRPHLIASLRSELARLLANPETRAEWRRSGRIPVVKVGKIPFAPGPAGSRTLGRGVAGAIARRIGR